MKYSSFAFAVAGAIIATQPVLAQEWPSGPIRMIVGYPAGGTTDVIARALSEQLSTQLGTPVLVENRAGAGGIVGASEVVGAPADGYTFLVAASPEIAIAPATGREMPFDPREDLEPVSLVCEISTMLVVNASVPADTVDELEALAKEQPGKLNYASFGTGTSNHLTGELFKAETGLDIVHIPFKGGAPAMTDLLGGRVQMMFESVSAVQKHVEAGTLKALGFASDERSALMPDVPTLDEAGVSGFVGGSWVGVLAPADTSSEITERMSKEIAAAIESPKLAELLAGRGLQCPGSTSEEFAQFIDKEINKWSEVAKRAGIEAE